MRNFILLFGLLVFILSCEESDLPSSEVNVNDTTIVYDTIKIYDSLFVTENIVINDTVIITDTILVEMVNLSNLYQTWHTDANEYSQFGFSIQEDGQIEFLQWELETGQLISPFKSKDQLNIDQDSLKYYMTLNNCHSGDYSIYSFDIARNQYFGYINELTGSSMNLSAFILDYSYQGGIDFIAIDRDNFKKTPLKSHYSATVKTHYLGNKTYKEYYFQRPDIAANVRWSVMLSGDSLSITLWDQKEPCINGNSYVNFINLSIHEFKGTGQYSYSPDNDRSNPTYLEIQSDIIGGFPIDSVYVDIQKFENNNRIAGQFELSTDNENISSDIQGSFDMYLDEKWEVLQ